MPAWMKAKPLPQGTEEAVELALTAGEAAAIWWAAAFTAEQPALPTLERTAPTGATLWQRLQQLLNGPQEPLRPVEAFKAHIADVVNLLLNTHAEASLEIKIDFDAVDFPVVSFLLEEALTAAGADILLDSWFIGSHRLELPAVTHMVVTRDRVVVRYGPDTPETTVWSHI